MRSTISVDDGSSLTREALEKACLNGSEQRLDRFGIVVGGQSHHDVDLAHVDELAKKIIRQKRLFSQFNPRLKLSRHHDAGSQHASAGSDTSQPEPKELIRPYG